MFAVTRKPDSSFRPPTHRNLTMQLAKIALATVALSFGLNAAQAAEAQPSVVIVHGAFADGSDWAKVIPLLQAKGVRVTAVQNPLTSLDDDVAATQRAIATAPGKVVLVGHSWGGTVITQAGVNDKVASLVYVAAFAPDVGQAIGDLGKAYPAPAGLAHLQADAAGFLRLSDEGVAKHFAQDLPAAQTAVMAATQGPVAAKAFGEKVSVAAWKSKPSWYVVAGDDHMIQPALQRDFAEQIGAKVSEVKTSHVPQQSAPSQVAAAILDAVQHSK